MIIRAITTNKGKTLDRYTIYFYNGICLTLSSNPDSPQGVSQFGEYYGLNDEDFYQAAVHKQKILENETLINFFELPSVVQAHIEKRLEK